MIPLPTSTSPNTPRTIHVQFTDETNPFDPSRIPIPLSLSPKEDSRLMVADQYADNQLEHISANLPTFISEDSADNRSLTSDDLAIHLLRGYIEPEDLEVLLSLANASSASQILSSIAHHRISLSHSWHRKMLTAARLEATSGEPAAFMVYLSYEPGDAALSWLYDSHLEIESEKVAYSHDSISPTSSCIGSALSSEDILSLLQLAKVKDLQSLKAQTRSRVPSLLPETKEQRSSALLMHCDYLLTLQEIHPVTLRGYIEPDDIRTLLFMEAWVGSTADLTSQSRAHIRARWYRKVLTKAKASVDKEPESKHSPDLDLALHYDDPNHPVFDFAHTNKLYGDGQARQTAREPVISPSSGRRRSISGSDILALLAKAKLKLPGQEYKTVQRSRAVDHLGPDDRNMLKKMEQVCLEGIDARSPRHLATYIEKEDLSAILAHDRSSSKENPLNVAHAHQDSLRKEWYAKVLRLWNERDEDEGEQRLQRFFLSHKYDHPALDESYHAYQASKARSKATRNCFGVTLSSGVAQKASAMRIQTLLKSAHPHLPSTMRSRASLQGFSFIQDKGLAARRIQTAWRKFHKASLPVVAPSTGFNAATLSRNDIEVLLSRTLSPLVKTSRQSYPVSTWIEQAHIAARDIQCFWRKHQSRRERLWRHDVSPGSGHCAAKEITPQALTQLLSLKKEAPFKVPSHLQALLPRVYDLKALGAVISLQRGLRHSLSRPNLIGPHFDGKAMYEQGRVKVLVKIVCRADTSIEKPDNNTKPESVVPELPASLVARRLLVGKPKPIDGHARIKTNAQSRKQPMTTKVEPRIKEIPLTGMDGKKSRKARKESHYLQVSQYSDAPHLLAIQGDRKRKLKGDNARIHSLDHLGQLTFHKPIGPNLPTEELDDHFGHYSRRYHQATRLIQAATKLSLKSREAINNPPGGSTPSVTTPWVSSLLAYANRVYRQKPDANLQATVYSRDF